MKHFNTTIVYAGILLIVQALLMQACSTDVGGDEDRTASVATINAISDADDSDGEVIGEATIHWANDEPNRSTVDILLSSDSGTTYDTFIALNAHDTGEYVWDTNSVPDCRTCRLRIVAYDVAGNYVDPDSSTDPYPGDSSNDFIINNVPQVLGSAFYTDLNNDGPGNGDTIRVPFDKDVELLTAIASDIFIFPVLGDSIGPFSTVAKEVKQNELIITINDVVPTDFHLHIRELFDQEKLNLTAPSGMNLLDNISQGILFARDTGRTAAPSENGIDIAPTFGDSEQALGNDNTQSVAHGDVDGDGDLDLVTGNGFLSGELNRVWLNDGAGAFIDSGQALGDSETYSIALGDIDSDGDLDFVSGNKGENRVWLNNINNTPDQQGVFTDSGQALGDGSTHSLMLGDVDGDGDLDIVTGNNGQNFWVATENDGEANRVWLNDGSGVFTDTGQALGDGITKSIALGDVDGDSDLDIVTGNEFGANRVWLNDGSGVFADTGQALGDGLTKSVALGDVDDDGDLDLVTGNSGQVVALNHENDGEANRVWLNDGSGVFTDSGQLLFSNVTRSIALGDIDGDGDLDLVTGDTFESRVWLNNINNMPDQKGVFTDTKQILGDLDSTYAVALGDIDRDGDLDLVTGNFSGPNLVWLNSARSPLTSLFFESLQELGDADTRSIVLGDIDGDSDLDLVTLDFGDARVWLNNVNNTTDQEGVYTLTGQVLDVDANRIVLGDVDNDGDLDLVTGGGPNQVWLNNISNTEDQRGVFTDSGQRLGDSNTFSLALGDVDDDGDFDLITGNLDEPNRVWLNNINNTPDQQGVFTDSGQELVDGSTTSAIAIGDVDSDGDIDLVTGNDGANRVWLNNINNTPEQQGIFTVTEQALGNSDTRSIALGDVDGDGHLDVVTGNYFDSNRVWVNDGQRVFEDSGMLLGINATRSVVIVDVDSDGDPDLVTGNSASQANIVWLNVGNGIFTEAGPGLGSQTTLAVALGDVDGDGDFDLVTGNFAGETNLLWLNDF